MCACGGWQTQVFLLLESSQEFDFGHELSLEFDIAQFRDWLERLESARALIEVPMVNADRLWPLLQILHPKLPPHERNTPFDDRAVSDWLMEYREQRRWPASEPALPSSGDETLDGNCSARTASGRQLCASCATSVPAVRSCTARTGSCNGQMSFATDRSSKQRRRSVRVSMHATG